MIQGIEDKTIAELTQNFRVGILFWNSRLLME